MKLTTQLTPPKVVFFDVNGTLLSTGVGHIY